MCQGKAPRSPCVLPSVKTPAHNCSQESQSTVQTGAKRDVFFSLERSMPVIRVYNTPIYIFSDIHWGDERSLWIEFSRLLKEIDKEGARVLIVGDLYDIWIENLDTLRKVFEEDIKLIQRNLLAYVVGNHDSLVLKENALISPRVYPSLRLIVDDKVWHVEHGHFIGKWAWLFYILDKWDHWPFFQKIARAIYRSKLIASSGRNMKDPGYIRKAIAKARAYGASVAVIGHTHNSEIYVDKSQQHSVTYVNPGSAIDHFTYIVYRDGDFHREER